MSKKIILAYSGGLDTSCILHWLKKKYGFDVIAVYVNIGQNENLKEVKEKAIKIGARRCYIINAKKEFVEKFVWKALKADAIYENKYYLATALARPLIAQKVVEIAKIENTRFLSHGATGKGNDQVRFELSFKYLLPDAKIIAPWRIWNLKSRKDEINYAKKNKLPIKVSQEHDYSEDENIWHISHEGGELEDLKNPPTGNVFKWTKPIENAPNESSIIEITFNNGIPESIDNEKTNSVKIVEYLNKLGGTHSIGITDMVEDRLVGIKSRGIYEAPAAKILYFAHQELESITLSKDTLQFKQIVSNTYGNLVYNGLWFSNLKQALDRFVDFTQETVSGKIKLKLFKGNIITLARYSPYSLYSKNLATFQESSYNHKDAEGFINIYGLQLRLEGLIHKQLEK